MGPGWWSRQLRPPPQPRPLTSLQLKNLLCDPPLYFCPHCGGDDNATLLLCRIPCYLRYYSLLLLFRANHIVISLYLPACALCTLFVLY